MRYVQRRAFAVVVFLLCIAHTSSPTWGAANFVSPTSAVARPVRSNGNWQCDGERGAQVPQRWDIDLTRAADDALEGRVHLAGSPLLANGLLRGRVTGRRVAGSIDDAAGNHVADFVGVVAPNGSVRGSYQDRTGEVGRWSWDGPLPR